MDISSYAGSGAQIVILGTPMSSKNRGVLALGASLVNLCLDKIPNAQIKFLLGHNLSKRAQFRRENENISIEIVPYRLSFRSSLQTHFGWICLLSLLYHSFPVIWIRKFLASFSPWIQTIHDAQFIGDVRGGDSFSDIYGMKRFLLGSLEALTVIWVKGELVQFPQTFGPFKTSVSRAIARYILNHSSIIVARDKQSQNVAQQLLGCSKKVLLSPDVAFSLKPFMPSKINLDPPLTNAPTKGIVGVNVNGLMFNGGYTRDNSFGLQMNYATFLPELIHLLLKEFSGEIWLIPHTYGPVGSVESDNEAGRIVWDSLIPESRERVRMIATEYDCHELKGIIGECDFFIGSRMHSCVAALSQGIPCVGVAYSMKFEGVFDSVGMQEWVVDGRKTGNSDAVLRVIDLYRRRNTVRSGLGERAREAREKLQDVFSVLFREAGRGSRQPLAEPVAF